jgi:dUTP pyrophosphatase
MKFFCNPAFMASKIRPVRATEGACAYDLAAAITEPVTVSKDTGIVTVSTGIKLEIPVGVAALVFPRSSSSNPEKPHYGLTLANTLGLIDTDYRGYILLKVMTFGPSFVIRPYDRIAQLLLVLQPHLELQVVGTESELMPSVRMQAGFGHTTDTEIPEIRT